MSPVQQARHGLASQVWDHTTVAHAVPTRFHVHFGVKKYWSLTTYRRWFGMTPQWIEQHGGFWHDAMV